jgi:hypothetical protein
MFYSVLATQRRARPHHRFGSRLTVADLLSYRPASPPRQCRRRPGTGRSTCRRFAGEQLPGTSDLDVGASAREEVPKQHLVRRQYRSLEPHFQRLDCGRRSKAVPSDENRLRVGRHMPRCPFVDPRGINPPWIPWKLGTRCRDNVNALVSEVGCTQRVQLVVEPGWLHQRHPAYLEDAQRQHRRRACRCDRYADPRRQPLRQGGLVVEPNRIGAARRPKADHVDRIRRERRGRIVQKRRLGQRARGGPCGRASADRKPSGVGGNACQTGRDPPRAPLRGTQLLGPPPRAASRPQSDPTGQSSQVRAGAGRCPGLGRWRRSWSLSR